MKFILMVRKDVPPGNRPIEHVCTLQVHNHPRAITSNFLALRTPLGFNCDFLLTPVTNLGVVIIPPLLSTSSIDRAAVVVPALWLLLLHPNHQPWSVWWLLRSD